MSISNEGILRGVMLNSNKKDSERVKQNSQGDVCKENLPGDSFVSAKHGTPDDLKTKKTK